MSDPNQPRLDDPALAVRVNEGVPLAIGAVAGVFSGIGIYFWVTYSSGDSLPLPLKVAHILLSNCGRPLACPMGFLAVMGAVYLTGVLIALPRRAKLRAQWIPLRSELLKLVVRNSKSAGLHSIPAPARGMESETAAEESKSDFGDMDAVSESAQSASKQPQPAPTPQPAGAPRVGPARPPAGATPVPKPAQEAEPNPSEAAHFITNAIARSKVHSWLGARAADVLLTFLRHGPEAATQHNDDIGNRQESAVSASLLTGQLCEWALPLLGFLGTVWGLHEAIPPLKDGIQNMMKALHPGAQVQILRDAGMASFGEGFNGLMLAFDSTLVGLLGVLLVGSLLFAVRRKAMHALNEIHLLVDQAIRDFPAPSDTLRDLVHRLDLHVQGGLFIETRGETVPTALIIAEALQNGLLFNTQDGKSKSQIDHATALILRQLGQQSDVMMRVVARAVRELREQARRDTNVLSHIGTAQAEAARFTNILHLRSIAPDIRQIRYELSRMRGAGGGGDPEPQSESDDFSYVLDPFMRSIMTLPESITIEALAVSRDAVFACVAGTDRTKHMHLIQELAVPWGNDSVSLDGQIHAGDSQMDDTDEVLGISYAQRGHRLLTAKPGLIRAFRSKGNGAFEHEGEYAMDSKLGTDPFIWLASRPEQPLIPVHDGEFFALTMLDGRNASLSADLQRVLTSLLEGGITSIRHRHDQDFIVFADRNCLVVARLGPSGQFECVAVHQSSQTIVAVDICAGEQFVIYACEDHSIRQWEFADPHGSPRIISTPAMSGIHDLHVGGQGDSVVVRMGLNMALIDLRGGRLRLFDTGSRRIKRMSHSPDRDYLLLATDANEILLFSFGTRI